MKRYAESDDENSKSKESIFSMSKLFALDGALATFFSTGVDDTYDAMIAKIKIKNLIFIFLIAFKILLNLSNF
jgi:hypothetical protein